MMTACLSGWNAALKDNICRVASWKSFCGHLAVTSSPPLLQQVTAGNYGIIVDWPGVCKYFICDARCEPSALSSLLNIWFLGWKRWYVVMSYVRPQGRPIQEPVCSYIQYVYIFVCVYYHILYVCMHECMYVNMFICVWGCVCVYKVQCS